jgi:hypothetical protein
MLPVVKTHPLAFTACVEMPLSVGLPITILPTVLLS